MSATTVTDLGEKIRRHLSHQNAPALRRLLARYNYADIAEVLENILTTEEAVTCFQYLDMGLAAQVLASLDEERQHACLAAMGAVMGSKVLRLMAADDAVDILQEMDTAQSQKLLEEMPFDTDTRMIQNLLLEEPDTAAGLMATDFISVNINATVGEAMAEIKKAEEKDFIYYCYLVDDENKLKGVTSLKRLILLDESVPLSRMAEDDVKSLLTHFDQELVANLFRKYDNLLAMPVVDGDNVLRGIITIDDIVYVIDEETSEDIYRASGIEIEEIDEKHLLAGPVWDAVKARMPWLAITVVGQLFAALIIASQSETIRGAVIAISFMPLLTGLTGNMGSQTNTIAVRGMSQNLISESNIIQKLLRELRVAAAIGITFGTAVGLISFFLYHRWELSLLLFVWIIVSMGISAAVGIFVPYASDKYFKVDPATVGGPLITTSSDIITFSLYLYVLSLLMDRMI